jgi:hypothetical protein
LEVVLLGGGGWGGDIVSGRLRQSRAVGRGGVNSRGGSRFDAEGSEAEKEGVNVAGVRKADGTGDAVMVDGEAKKFGGDGMRLNVVERG